MIERALRKYAEIQIFLERWAKEGHYGALWENLIGVEYLMEGLEDWKTFFDDHSQQLSGSALKPAVSRASQRRWGRRQASPVSQAIPAYVRHEYYLQALQ
ncbi:transposase-like protein [Colletotrichum musicola]|uniref:Transposase-like protein n=1 Tax=Colletotrichum musicola TaxID=2175873 RepID=A0A8H6IRI1_9PEZI|nr:transposase-like protein [Colletotrichum musicola]